MILSVDSGIVRAGFRVKVHNIDTGDEFNVMIPEGTITEKQIHDLQHGGWEKQPLHMEINIERAGQRIVKATLTSAGLA